MIEMLVTGILLLSALSYLLLHVFLWNGLKTENPSESGQQHSFSIVIAARNEEAHLLRCIESAARQHYPADRFEVIVVDDRSTDRTAEIIAAASKQFPNIRSVSILRNDTDMPNKKNALREGISISRNDILAFTDADCTLPHNWLQQLSDHFTGTTGVVAGYSPYNTAELPWIGKKYLHAEELLNSVYAAAAAHIGRAFMCTGRNLAYRKKVYDDAGGFETIKHSISGDDDLFLQRVRTDTSWGIRYMFPPESHVPTVPPLSLSAFINQRTRHISASRFYPTDAKAALALIHLFPFIILASYFWLPLTSVIIAMVKINIDGMLIAKGADKFGETISLPEFIAGELLLPLYSLAVGPAGFLKKFSWKGEQPA